MRTAARNAILLSVLAAIVFAGCGAQNGGGGTVTLTGRAVTVLADQYFFDPSTINAKRGELEIEFQNKGNLIHNLVLERGGVRVAKAPSLEPNATASLTVKLAKGEYRLFCTVGDHEQLGMKGKVNVK